MASPIRGRRRATDRIVEFPFQNLAGDKNSEPTKSDNFVLKIDQTGPKISQISQLSKTGKSRFCRHGQRQTKEQKRKKVTSKILNGSNTRRPPDPRGLVAFLPQPSRPPPPPERSSPSCARRADTVERIRAVQHPAAPRIPATREDCDRRCRRRRWGRRRGSSSTSWCAGWARRSGRSTASRASMAPRRCTCLPSWTSIRRPTMASTRPRRRSSPP
jgi:hypothetical protein